MSPAIRLTTLMSVLAATEYSQKTGKDFLTALAIAYQVQCRLSEVAPARPKGLIIPCKVRTRLPQVSQKRSVLTR
jgi:hypothetical protein